MTLTIGALAICHTDKAPVWGRVMSIYADRTLILDRNREWGRLIEVKQADVIAVAETIAELDEAYGEHAATCGLCIDRQHRWLESLKGWTT